MAATKGGIYHNLRESEYVVSNSEITFFFSSDFYLKNFMSRYKQNRIKFNEKMKKGVNHHPLSLNFDTLADITLYRLIEKRGFFVRLKGAMITWHDLQKYALRKMTEKNTLNWSRTQKQKLSEPKKTMG